MKWLIPLVLMCSAPIAHAAEPGPTEAAPTAWPGTSLYHLDETWTDQNNAVRRLSDWAGAPVVIALIFSRCTYSCPITITHLQGLDAKLTPQERARVKVLLITLDPTFDTPEVLRAFAEKRGIDQSRWTLLHGNEAQVRALSVALSMRFKATGKGEFSHGRAITMLGPKGSVQYQGQEHAEELVAIRKPGMKGGE